MAEFDFAVKKLYRKERGGFAKVAKEGLRAPGSRAFLAR
jgi:hypothetical protein